MARTWSVLLGIGLVILWLAGLSSADTTFWLAWLDGIAAICAFIVAGVASPTAARSVRQGAPMALSIGLFALWIIGLATGSARWLTWWTFAFACAFMLVGIAEGAGRRPIPATTPAERTADRFRKSA